MRIIVRNYTGEKLNFVEFWPANAGVSQPTTAEEIEAISPRVLGSNEHIEVMEEVDSTLYYYSLVENKSFIAEEPRTTHSTLISPDYK